MSRTAENAIRKTARILTGTGLLLLELCLAALLLTGCGSGALPGSGGAGTPAGAGSPAGSPAVSEARRDFFAMDTFMTLTVCGPDAEEACDAAVAEISRLDQLFSTGNPESEVSKLNAAGSMVLSEDGQLLVKRSLETWKDTGGAFDIAIYPVMDAWGFTGEERHVPAPETLEKLLPLCDAGKLQFDESSGELKLPEEGMMIDFGGVVKGYASADVIGILRSRGIGSACLNLGGNVQVLGKKQNGDPWRIAVRDPEKEDKYLGVLHLTDTAAVTSGGYERFFEQNGKTYHHIIDPKTGYPADNGLTSVTIVTPDGTLADMLSTALFILGTDRAVRYCEDHRGEFDAILFTDDRKLYATAGLREILQPAGSVTWIAE